MITSGLIGLVTTSLSSNSFHTCIIIIKDYMVLVDHMGMPPEGCSLESLTQHSIYNSMLHFHVGITIIEYKSVMFTEVRYTVQ
jgi:hypothetical protein